MYFSNRAVPIVLAILLVHAHAVPVPQMGDRGSSLAPRVETSTPSPLEQMVDNNGSEKHDHNGKDQASRNENGYQAQQADATQSLTPDRYNAVPGNTGASQWSADSTPLSTQSGVSSLGLLDPSVTSGAPSQQAPAVIVIAPSANKTRLDGAATPSPLSAQGGLAATGSGQYNADPNAVLTPPSVQAPGLSVTMLGGGSSSLGQTNSGYGTTGAAGGLLNNGITSSDMLPDAYQAPIAAPTSAPMPTASAIAKAVVKQLCKMASRQRYGSSTSTDDSIGKDEPRCDLRALFGLTASSNATRSSSTASTSGSTSDSSKDKDRQMEDFMNSSAGASAKAETPASDPNTSSSSSSKLAGEASPSQADQSDKPNSTGQKSDESKESETSNSSPVSNKDEKTDDKPKEEDNEPQKVEEKKPDEKPEDKKDGDAKPDDKKPADTEADDKKPDEKKDDQYSGNVTVEKGGAGSPPPKREIAYAARDVDVLDRRSPALEARAERLVSLKASPLFNRRREAGLSSDSSQLQKRSLVWATHVVLQRRASTAFAHAVTGAVLIACMAFLTVTWANTVRRLQLR